MTRNDVEAIVAAGWDDFHSGYKVWDFLKKDSPCAIEAVTDAAVAEAERRGLMEEPPAKPDPCPACGMLHYGKSQRKTGCDMVRDKRGGWRQLGVYDG